MSTKEDAAATHAAAAAAGTVEDKLGDLAPLYDQIQCAFCLNPHATNRVTIPDKGAPIDSSLEDNGKAVAFLCDDHKDQKPKYGLKVYDKGKRVTLVDIIDLPTIAVEVHEVPPQPGPMPEGPTTSASTDASVKAQESPPA